MCIRVIGRERELGEVERFLDAAGRSFETLVLEGESGIGKTTLWREARNRAEQRGQLVLRCRPSPAEAKLSFAAVADLLEPVDEAVVAALPEPQRAALEVVLLRAGSMPAPPSARAVAVGFLTLIRQLASTRSVVVAVDDWQWLDSPSRRVLEFAGRRLEAEPIGLLCTARSPLVDPPVGGAVSADRLQRLMLSPLSVAALGAVTAAQLGRPLPRPWLVRISEVSRGNPFYALEIARLVLERDIEQPTSALPVPDDLRDLTLSRIRRLPTTASEALLVASVMANPTVDVLGADALGAAEKAGIVTVDDAGRIEFAHPIFASAMYASASIAKRRELHRHAAQLVIDPEQRARHLALGSDGGDRSVAKQLDVAAARAGSRGMPATAAELAELAAQRTPDEDSCECARRLLSAARFQFDAGDLARAQALAEIVIAQDGALSERASALQLSAQLAARLTSFSRAADLAAEALNSAADDGLRAEIELDLAHCDLGLGKLADAQAHASEAVALAERAGEDGLLGDALAVSTMVGFLCGRGDDRSAMARALTLEDPLRRRSWIAQPSLIEGMLKLWTGELQGAVQTMSAVHSQSIDRGVESFVPTTALFRVWAGVWSGDLSQAARWSEEALTAAELLHDPSNTGIALGAAALLHAYAGSLDEARAEATEALALLDGLDWRTGSIWPSWALGLVELSDRNPAAADAVLRPLADQLTAMGETDPAWAPFVPDAVEAMIALGEVEPAAAYLGPFLKRSKELDRVWAVAAAERCLGELEATRGDLDAACAAFERALAAHNRGRMPFERARTLLVAGRVARRFKQRGQARSLLGEATAVFEELGAARWAANARSELERVGWPGRGTELTETEERIARLVAEGLTNQEIAGRAFLSVKTVEANLTRIYRKLGLGSRVALANAVRPPDPSHTEHVVAYA